MNWIKHAKMKLLTSVLALAIALFPVVAYGNPVVELRQGEVLITLYDEPCVLPEVTNLPDRAEWFEKGTKTEGCWSINPQAGIVVMYFADKTVAIAPIRAFTKVSNI